MLKDRLEDALAACDRNGRDNTHIHLTTEEIREVLAAMVGSTEAPAQVVEYKTGKAAGPLLEQTINHLAKEGWVLFDMPVMLTKDMYGATEWLILMQRSV